MNRILNILSKTTVKIIQMPEQKTDKAKKSTTNWLITIVLVIIVGAAAFFGGMKYQQSKTPSFAGNFGNGSGAPSFNGSVGGNQRSGSTGPSGGSVNRLNFSPVEGEIISSDDQSITVKLQDGSSKIVLMGGNTSINKAESGTKDDLSEGVNVMVIGQENSDGTVTATSIQIGSGFFRGQTVPTQ